MDTQVSVGNIEVHADTLDPVAAAAIYREHGALVVRGLMRAYVDELRADFDRAVAQAIELLPQATKGQDGWHTPDGTLWLPAPEGYGREQQIMVLALTYTRSAAFLRSGFESKTIAILEQIVGPNIELFMNGQCLYKEPSGGHPKHLHQDSAYFDHRFDGPVGVLSYASDTHSLMGPLHVVPGSHRFGTLEHTDTFSHLGLDSNEWPWERALEIEGQAGDSIFFHFRTIHGSKENHADVPRPAFIHRYRRPDDFVVTGGSSTKNRAANDANAATSRREPPGFMVRGFRDHVD